MGIHPPDKTHLPWGKNFCITPNNVPPVTLDIKPIKAKTTPDVLCEENVTMGQTESKKCERTK